ncbi:synaptotagmin-16 [Ischnura elegans]|uniref:synaptotagmin-16 n=1 Tax=Ischnura elegans TaxID=197161 RepID=UPI001ED8B259|nr:synaptotagmin-16 [Ischnura elegans]
MAPPVASMASSASGDKGSGADLISLAEKGRAGGASSGGGSSSCSTTSGDEEAAAGGRRGHRQPPPGPGGGGGGRRGLEGGGGGEQGGQQRALRHRDPRAFRKVPPPPVQDITLLSENPRDHDCIVVVPHEQHLLEAYPGGESGGRDSVAPQTATTTSSSGSPSPPPPSQCDHPTQGGVQQPQTGPEIQSAPSPTPLVSKCGHLEVAFAYDAPLRKMSVHVLQARGIPARDRGGSTHTQVRMILLPSKKQKHKTKIRQGDNPQYMESFLLHRVNPEDVNSMGVRFRLYGCERMRRERLIGEYVVGFAAINLELETTLWLPLEPRASLAHQSSASDLLSLARSDSTGSTHSMQHGGVPELLLGLAYNGTTGRLSAEIVKGSHFRDMAMTRAPDTHVRLCLVSSSGQELAHSKTSVRRSQPNPLFKEVFMFQVALFQLPDVTLMISVYNKRSMKRKEMVGWFSLGLNSSGEEELAHWNDMRDAKGEQICRWHVLLES